MTFIIEIFTGTYGFLWRNRGELFARAPLFLVVLMITVWAFAGVGGSSSVWIGVRIAGVIAAVALLMHFAVAWHLLVLRGPEAAGGALHIRFRGREFKFLGLSVLSNAFDKLSEMALDRVFAKEDETLGLIVAVHLIVALFATFLSTVYLRLSGGAAPQ